MSISISNAIAEGAKLLRAAGLSDPRRESGSLLAHAIGRDRTFLIAHFEDQPAAEQIETFRSFVSRRAGGEPLQYITGHQEFFKLDFEVTPDVLIPRPETELLVETALEYLADDPEPYFADIGTGSGCIAISILCEMANARAVASDISPAALRVAQRNAEHHGVADRLALVESDGFFALGTNKTFSLIVSNPPYIPKDELKKLQREVQKEPYAALAAGSDGLSVIRRLLREAPLALRSRGHFVFEIGFAQSKEIKKLIDAENWEFLGIQADLQGIARTVVLQKK